MSCEEQDEVKNLESTGTKEVVSKYVIKPDFDKLSITEQADYFSDLDPNQSYSELDWTEFFDSEERIDGTTQLYKAGKGEGPLILCMHGAGHSALSFACLA